MSITIPGVLPEVKWKLCLINYIIVGGIFEGEILSKKIGGIVDDSSFPV